MKTNLEAVSPLKGHFVTASPNTSKYQALDSVPIQGQAPVKENLEEVLIASFENPMDVIGAMREMLNSHAILSKKYNEEMAEFHKDFEG